MSAGRSGVTEGHVAEGAAPAPLRLAAWGGVVGPAIFVADWAILGALRPGYSPVADAISRLAETGSSTRPEMTGGFLVYGLGLIGFGAALRRALPPPAWVLAVATGAATLGVAAFPLGAPVSGKVHAVFASLGYTGLAALQLTAARALERDGRRRAARISLLTGCLTATSLLASAIGLPAHGFTQRVGLTAGDAWVVATSLNLLGRKPRTRPLSAPAR